MPDNCPVNSYMSSIIFWVRRLIGAPACAICGEGGAALSCVLCHRTHAGSGSTRCVLRTQTLDASLRVTQTDVIPECNRSLMLPGHELGCPVPLDFLWDFVGSTHFMRLSSQKAAHETVDGAVYRKSRYLARFREMCEAPQNEHPRPPAAVPAPQPSRHLTMNLNRRTPFPPSP